ncbi:S1C family serine protease [Amycolatopsis alkalitolerans]|uniref:PDZ domain-containing protein n=1 Tax=Amycolatopsis alkalitolerans TaxID=2547244 RepID=A0A5C4LXH4_9PSEU|nr:trypsin-like peptidase domain-containing protein [Amycolatopsis alkalitolerans]TNC23688.1 PDZ domain-containing protein [Amycolatopsis alkalitolerans]
MTENDPSTPDGNEVPKESQPAQEDATTPPRGTSFSGEQQEPAPSPWSAQAQQHQAYAWTSPSHQQQHAQGQPYGTAAFTAQQPAAIPQQRRGSGKLVAGVAVLALLVGGGAGAAGGYFASQNSGGGSYNALNQPVPSQQTSHAPAGSVESVAQRVSPSVVELVVAGQQEQGEGSGFVLSTDGYILTNNHVVQVAANGGSIQAVFADGTKADASIVGRDPTTDIAVVKVNGVKNLSPVTLGNSDATKVGESVVAFGSPFELTGTVTSGIVSALHRPVRAGGSSGDQTTVMSAIQTDAAINPGNSGGPLVNLSGQVIGIDSAIYSPQSSGGFGGQSEATNAGIGFAIPINQARRTAQEIISTGKATQTYIGATVSDARSGGAQIVQVQQGSPADKAGLKAGDVVTKIDNLVINDADGLIAAVRTRAPNDKVTFTLSDNRTLQVTLGGQPVQVN